MSEANLVGACLDKASFTNVNLSEANLTGASFHSTIFKGVDINNTLGFDNFQIPDFFKKLGI